MIIIYALKDPINNSIRYIGQTSNIKTRFNNHLKGNKYRKTHTTNWIQSLLNLELKPILIELDKCEKKDIDIVEQKYIKEYKEKGYDLTNHSIGGHSSLGCKHSLESRLKRSINSKGRKHKYSEESLNNKKLKHSIYILNNPNQRIDNILSKDARYKAALKGNKIASEKAKKKVLKKDFNNKIIEVYDSLIEAAKLNNINKVTLGSYCRGKYKQNYKDFYFTYDNNEYNINIKSK